MSVLLCDWSMARGAATAILLVTSLFRIDTSLAAVVGDTIGSVERLDPAIDSLVPADTELEVIADGLDWCEGPLWIPQPGTPDGGFLIFSDIPPNTIFRWDPKNGKSV